MKKITILVLSMLFLGVGHLAAQTNWTGPMVAKVILRSTTVAGMNHGEIRIFEIEKGLKFVGNISGVSPGKHGIHIHENGDCGDGGNAAGGHFNPHGVQHGFAPKDKLTGAHPGDMGNVVVDKSGHGSYEVMIRGIGLTERQAVLGKSVILHEKEDDFSQPTGNAGGRIACGIIEAVEAEAPAAPVDSPWIKKN